MLGESRGLLDLQWLNPPPSRPRRPPRGPNDRAGANDAALGQGTSGRVGRGGAGDPPWVSGSRREFLGSIVFFFTKPKGDDFIGGLR